MRHVETFRARSLAEAERMVAAAQFNCNLLLKHYDDMRESGKAVFRKEYRKQIDKNQKRFKMGEEFPL